MEVTKKLSPGAPGTKRFSKKFGHRLVCVRYRNDPKNRRRLTTVEIIVDERPFGEPRRHPFRGDAVPALASVDEEENG